MNKIVNFLRTHIAYVSIFLFILIIFLVLLIDNKSSLSNDELSREVYIYPENSNPENDPGSWVLHKSANWINQNRVRIDYSLNTNELINNKAKDVLIVLDSSEYMNEDRDYSSYFDGGTIDESTIKDESLGSSIINHLKNVSNYLLTEEEQDNKMALVTFNDIYKIETDFINDFDAYSNFLDNIDVNGTSNYERALEGIDSILHNYSYSNNRELIIVLIIGDISSGNENREKVLYEELKENYPFITINLIADYTVSNNNRLDNICDKLYIVGENTGGNDIAIESSKKKYNFIDKLSGNSKSSVFVSSGSFLSIISNITYNKRYTEFKIIDNLNEEYFTLKDHEIVYIDTGSVDLEYTERIPVLTWTLDRNLLSGETVTLSVELSLKDDLVKEDKYFPVSKTSNIKSIIDGVSDENVNTILSPVLNLYNHIYFDLSGLNDTCVINTPESEKHYVGETIDLSDNIVSCEGYTFEGWTNDEYNSIEITEMPGFDIYLKPILLHMTISKSIPNTATLSFGIRFNYELKRLAGNYYSNITKVKYLDELTDDFNINNAVNIASEESFIPIYAWYKSSVIYIYSSADVIYLNENSSGLFKDFNMADDFSILEKLDFSNVTDMSSMFENCNKIENLSYLRNANVSNVTDMIGLFRNCNKLSNLEFLENWDVSKVTSISDMFYGCNSITNVDSLLNWDVSHLASIDRFLYNCTLLENINGLRNWNTKGLLYMVSAFQGDEKIESLEPLRNWNTSNVIRIYSAFSSMKNIKNLEGLENWDVSKIVYFDYLFNDCEKLENVNALRNWNTSNMGNISWMFYNNKMLSDISGLSNWDVSNVTDTAYAFAGCEKLENLNALRNWNTSKFRDVENMFNGCSGLNDVSGINDWNLVNTVVFYQMFKNVNIHPEFTKVQGTWDSEGTFTLDGGE